MNDLLTKLTSYNIFNYLFPGAVFGILGEKLGFLADADHAIWRELLLYYFFGFVISRLGSLALEPLLRRVKFVEFAEYSKYLVASERDPKMALMIENLNSIRTMAMTFISLMLCVGMNTLANYIGIPINAQNLLAIGGISVVFVFAYRRQVGFVVQRINHFSP